MNKYNKIAKVRDTLVRHDIPYSLIDVYGPYGPAEIFVKDADLRNLGVVGRAHILASEKNPKPATNKIETLSLSSRVKKGKKYLEEVTDAKWHFEPNFENVLEDTDYFVAVEPHDVNWLVADLKNQGIPYKYRPQTDLFAAAPNFRVKEMDMVAVLIEDMKRRKTRV